VGKGICTKERGRQVIPFAYNFEVFIYAQKVICTVQDIYCYSNMIRILTFE